MFLEWLSVKLHRTVLDFRADRMLRQAQTGLFVAVRALDEEMKIGNVSLDCLNNVRAAYYKVAAHAIVLQSIRNNTPPKAKGEKMKLAVVSGSARFLNPSDEARLENLLNNGGDPIDEIIILAGSSVASGVTAWANKKQIKVSTLAGGNRSEIFNQVILPLVDAVLLFHGEREIEDMRVGATGLGKRVIDWRD